MLQNLRTLYLSKVVRLILAKKSGAYGGVGGNQPIKNPYLTSAKAISVVLRGEITDVCRVNTDVRWVGFHPLA
jgi:hypothetical protein